MTDALKLAEELESAPFGEEHRLVRRCLECGLRNKWISMRQWKRADAMVKAGAYLSAADVLRPEVCDWDSGYLSENKQCVAHMIWKAPAGKRFAEFFDAGPDTEVSWCETSHAATEPMARAAAATRARVAMEKEGAQDG